MILLHEFVHSNEGPGPPHPSAAVHQDGLWLDFPAPDVLDHVEHDPRVLGGCQVSPLLGLEMGHLADQLSKVIQIEDSIEKENKKNVQQKSYKFSW